MNYFVKTDDKETGPFTAGEIQRWLLADGAIQFSLVRREDTDTWSPLSSLSEFREGAGVASTNRLAIASVVLGIVSLPLLFATLRLRMPLFLLTSLAGIILGHVAANKVGRSPHTRRQITAARWGLWLNYSAALILPMALSFIIPVFSKTCEKGNMTKGISNCRQIITALRIYAADNSGSYPGNGPDFHFANAKTSNDAFRELFINGVLNNELIFDCPNSPLNPNGKIGSPPHYEEALKSGENHWALTKGITDSPLGNLALVFENPVVATWPPRWSAPKQDSTSPGRSWFGGKIIIGTNDSSVTVMKLEESKDPTLGLAPLPDGTSPFPDLDPVPVILNVAP